MKKGLLIGILSAVAIWMCACGEANNGGAVIVEKEAIPVEDEFSDAQEDASGADSSSGMGDRAAPESDTSRPGAEKGASVSGGGTDAYGSAYEKIVADQEGEAFAFSLIYLDGDDIPELAVCDRGYGTYSVYTVKNGEAFCMVDAMTTVEMAYFERSGVIAQFERWNGGGDEGGYGWYYYQVSKNRTLADGDTADLHYTYDAVYDEKGNWTGTGITKYYLMGAQTDEKTYRQKVNDLGIAEGSEKTCTDNALNREEMLTALAKGETNASGEGGKPQESTDTAKDSGRQQADTDAVKAAYYSVLDKISKTHTLPDGTDLGYDEVSPLSDNQFAVYDIDGDGQEELIVIWVTTYTAGMTEIIYGFDSATGTVREEFREFPLLTFYDNGAVEAGMSHNHGLAGDMDFWPYTLYQYDKNADRYVTVGVVDAWNRAFYEKDYNGNAFPDDIDADDDGVVYKITRDNEEKLMDLDAYEKWRNSVISAAKNMEIPFAALTEMESYF